MTTLIPDKLFFKIGEVADLAGVEQHVLRYWEDEIDALKCQIQNSLGDRLRRWVACPLHGRPSRACTVKLF